MDEEAPSVIELDWASDMAQHPAGPGRATFDMIIGADLAYDEDAFQPLLSCMLAFISHSPATRVCILSLGDCNLQSGVWSRVIALKCGRLFPAVMQVILALPERAETAPFLELADQVGLRRRRLRRAARPDLATSISIHQLMFDPAQSAQGAEPVPGSPTVASKVS